ncbi:PAS domain S-box protein [Candidatus Poribacteria bacterium]|nr:PAS domain S-box protein [Candidatus Poribacteria bacterium]
MRMFGLIIDFTQTRVGKTLNNGEHPLGNARRRSKTLKLVLALIVAVVTIAALGTAKFLDVTGRHALEQFSSRQMLLVEQTADIISVHAELRSAAGKGVDPSFISEKILKKLADNTGSEVLLLDENGIVVAEQSSPDLVGRHYGEYFSEEEAPGLRPVVERMISGAKGWDTYEKAVEKDGKAVREKMLIAYAPVNVSGSRWSLGLIAPRSAGSGYFVRNPFLIIALASSRVLALLITIGVFIMLNTRRIAAKREAERLRQEQMLMAQLEESEERYKTLVDNLLSSVLIFQDSRIRFANRRFYEVSGYTQEDILGEDFNVFSLIHEEDRAVSLDKVAGLMQGRPIEEPREIRFIKKSGEIMVGLTLSSLVHFEGRPAVETVVVDITHMKKMEQELSSTRKRLEYLLDNAPVMIFSLDDMGRFSYANQETLRATGYRYDDWIGKSFAPIVHPDDLAIAVAKFEEGRRGLSRRDYKVRIRNADGEARVLHILAGTIWNDEQFAGSLIIARDITEQQRLEQAVKEARDRLANIIENAGDAIITLDSKGCIVSWNKSAELMFGFAEPDTFRMPLQSTLASDASRLAELLDRVAKGETIRNVEFECKRREGTRFDALFTCSPIRDITGNVVGISCFAKDITERRRLEGRLQADKQFIDQLIENANALIGAANERGKTVIFNRRFEELTGFRKEELFGKDPLLLVPEESREIVRKQIGELRADRPLLNIEIPIVTKGGRVLTVMWNAASVNLPSGNAAVVVVGQDVTEQKRMQEELVQSKKLASIGELVSGVAHELNNPLTVVMGYSQLLTTEQKLSEKHHEMARKILDAAARSKRIVENLLAFARKKKLEKRETNINEILENTLSLREHTFTVNNIKVVRNYDEKLPPIYADGGQLQQVFLNLINNAFDAMHDSHQGGALEVRTCLLGRELMVEIIDDGPGVPEAIQEKIFDPFFTTKEVGKGTGLGMSLSYGIVKEHGGRIYLDKTHTDGAKFVVALPLTSAPSPAVVVRP